MYVYRFGRVKIFNDISVSDIGEPMADYSFMCMHQGLSVFIMMTGIIFDNYPISDANAFKLIL